MGASMNDHRLERLLKQLDRKPAPAKADLKELEVWKHALGHAIDAAISMANRTAKECWVELGHEEGSRLSRWIAGTERPVFEALFAIGWLRQPLVIALAHLAEGVEVETTIRIRRSA
jgi:hypothetical protein